MLTNYAQRVKFENGSPCTKIQLLTDLPMVVMTVMEYSRALGRDHLVGLCIVWSDFFKVFTLSLPRAHSLYWLTLKSVCLSNIMTSFRHSRSNDWFLLNLKMLLVSVSVELFSKKCSLVIIQS